MKTPRFTFKTEKPTGKWRTFNEDTHLIKMNKKEVGLIGSNAPHYIRFMIKKKDINEDGNPNCEWKWIQLGNRFESVSATKEFLNENINQILTKYELYPL